MMISCWKKVSRMFVEKYKGLTAHEISNREYFKERPIMDYFSDSSEFRIEHDKSLILNLVQSGYSLDIVTELLGFGRDFVLAHLHKEFKKVCEDKHLLAGYGDQESDSWVCAMGELIIYGILLGYTASKLSEFLEFTEEEVIGYLEKHARSGLERLESETDKETRKELLEEYVRKEAFLNMLKDCSHGLSEDTIKGYLAGYAKGLKESQI